MALAGSLGCYATISEISLMQEVSKRSPHTQHTREKSGIRGGNALTSRYLGARDRGVAGKP